LRELDDQTLKDHLFQVVTGVFEEWVFHNNDGKLAFYHLSLVGVGDQGKELV
jgi:hypothetical protein